MGRFVNPDNSAFQDVLNSKVYVDQVSNRCNSSPTLEVGDELLEKDKKHLQVYCCYSTLADVPVLSVLSFFYFYITLFFFLILHIFSK